MIAKTKLETVNAYHLAGLPSQPTRCGGPRSGLGARPAGNSKNSLAYNYSHKLIKVLDQSADKPLYLLVLGD